jgi:uncharacterized protein YaiI (UPF0178 family)
LLEIYLDADGCPVKEETYRVARRYGLPVYVVAGRSLGVPNEANIRPVAAGKAFDAADDWIAEHVGEDDIAVTADIPLAARCLEKGAWVLSPRGQDFTDENIGDALASRALMDELRQMGLASGGPSPMGRQERSRYLSRLDEVVQAIRRSRKS